MGISGGNANRGSTSTAAASAAGAGDGADFFFLVALFLVFFMEAAAMPAQQHRRASKRAHAMIGMKNPEEPEAVEPELAWEPEESSEVNESNDAEDIKEAEEAPEEPDEESHGVNVVVGVSVGMAGGTVVATTSFFFLSLGASVGSLAWVPATAPPTIAAAPAVAPTPMPIFSANVRPFGAGAGAATTTGAQGLLTGVGLATGADGATVPQGLAAAARPMMVSNTATRNDAMARRRLVVCFEGL